MTRQAQPVHETLPGTSVRLKWLCLQVLKPGLVPLHPPHEPLQHIQVPVNKVNVASNGHVIRLQVTCLLHVAAHHVHWVSQWQ